VTSAGKTTFLHNLAHHLAAGKEFLGLLPPRPLRVLYIDFESHDGVLVEHLQAIGTHPNVYFLELADDPIRGPELLTALTEIIRHGRYEGRIR
jgi:hypothetical protein